MSKKILFWLGVFAVSLLVMVRPAAADGPVNLLPGTITYYISSMTYSGGTPEAAATSFISQVWAVGYSFHHVSVYGVPSADLWMGYKIQNSTGTISQVGVINHTTSAQNCPPNSHLGGPSACTCDSAYLPNSEIYADAVSCVLTCPNITHNGYHFMSGALVGTQPPPGGVFCDQPTGGCVITANTIASVFNHGLVQITESAQVCPITGSKTVLTVEFQDRGAPDLTKFDDVVAAAVAVDAAKTEQARADAYIAKVVADGIAAKIAADTAAAQAAIDAQKQAVTEVKRAAGQVTASPTTTNVNNYNGAVTNYNNTVSVVSNGMTQLQNDYSVQAANGNNAQGSVTDATAIQAQIDALIAAIAASGQPYDVPSVGAKTAGYTALNDQLTAAVAALAAAQVELVKASALATQAALDIAAAAKSLADTAAAIKALLDGLSGLPPPVPPIPPPPPPPGGPPTPYCVDHPTDPACKAPEPVDCTATPDAPGCKDICKDHPERAGCADLGTVPDDVPLGEKTITISAITPVAVGGVGACPAPIPMVLHGKTYYMKFDTYCNFANGIKPIILVFAWLAAAGILIGGFKAS